ncbi:hypothetical protein NDU88_002005 [Pleurodeles waltl]|uniref:Uncharacterized protein n=1 Tax=Pleurodeles waltl TaxID=8319 RepID=A0AAV7MLE9_PLEWA|nr:hypothetical protein NDU88_002005 [Pleurodeles waltl]
MTTWLGQRSPPGRADLEGHQQRPEREERRPEGPGREDSSRTTVDRAARAGAQISIGGAGKRAWPWE